MKNKRNIYVMLFFTLSLGLVFCSSTKQNKTEQVTEEYNGIKYIDLEKGSGRSPEIGKKVTINMILADEKGNEIENTFKNKKPVTFTVQAIESDKLEVIRGLQEGIMTMKQGGKRKFWVPPDKGFGARASRQIPQNSTLIFEVELIKVFN